MSILVDLADLPAEIASRFAAPFLLTSGTDRPRVVSVSVTTRADGALAMSVGNRTAENVQAHPAVTLLWPPDTEHPDHALLVDGDALLGLDNLVEVAPTGAVMHVMRS